jgi:trimeric autotransporter adhesin
MLQHNVAATGAEQSLQGVSGGAPGPTPGQRLERLLSHDFSSQHGRSVAERNAFILLRKRQFAAAIAVFLLPRPAMLKEALQVALMHLKDPALALLLARLIERRDSDSSAAAQAVAALSSPASPRYNSSSSNSSSRSSVAAAVTSPLCDSAAAALGGASRRLLREELLPLFAGTMANSAAPADAFLESAVLVWLRQPARAFSALHASNAALTLTTTATAAATDAGDSGACSAALALLNSAIDAAVQPLLLQRLSAVSGAAAVLLEQKRAVAGSVLADAQLLSDRGMQLSALQLLNSTAVVPVSTAAATGQSAAADTQQQQQWQSNTAASTPWSITGGSSSSAVDTGELAGDLFSSFDAAPQQRKQSRKSSSSDAMASGELSGDLFGDYDAPPRPKPQSAAVAKPAVSSAVDTGELSGDLFGDYDAPPRPQPKAVVVAKPAASTAVDSGELSGDMFGDYDAPPRPQPKAAVVAKPAMNSAVDTGELSGDMFGVYDAPPPKTQQQQQQNGSSAKLPAAAAAPHTAAVASGELSSDLFGEFDTAPQQRAIQLRSEPAAKSSSSANTTAAVASGELSSDMFGDFETPPPRRSKALPATSTPAVAAASSAVDTGELSGDMFGDFDVPRKSALRVITSSKQQQGGSTSSSSGGQYAAVSPATSVRSITECFSPASCLSAAVSPTAAIAGAARHMTQSPQPVQPGVPRVYGYQQLSDEPAWEAYDAQALLKHADTATATSASSDSSAHSSDQSAGDATGESTSSNSSSAGEEVWQWRLLQRRAQRAAAGARLLRELHAALLDCCATTPSITAWEQSLSHFRTATAAVVTAVEQTPLQRVCDCIAALSAESAVNVSALASCAAAAAESSGSEHQLAAACLMLQALGRSAAANIAVCRAAQRLLQCCSVHCTTATSATATSTLTTAASSTLTVAFQLQLCLALQHSGALRLSARAQLDASVGTRVGLLLHAWEAAPRYDLLAVLLACPPRLLKVDCALFAGLEVEHTGTATTSTASGAAGERKDSSSGLTFTALELMDRVRSAKPGTTAEEVLLGSALTHYAQVSRAAAEAALSSQPPGTLLLRPFEHPDNCGSSSSDSSTGGTQSTATSTTAVSLSFTVRASSASKNSSAAAPAQYVCHAVLRAVALYDTGNGSWGSDMDSEPTDGCSSSGASGPSIMYASGSIGPCHTLAELLCAISDALPCPLLLDPACTLGSEAAAVASASGGAKGTAAARVLAAAAAANAGDAHDTTDAAAVHSDAALLAALSALPATTAAAAADDHSAVAAAIDVDSTTVAAVSERHRWPLQQRLQCVLNLLILRALHRQLCDAVAALMQLSCSRALPPFATRCGGAVPSSSSLADTESTNTPSAAAATAVAASQQQVQSGKYSGDAPVTPPPALSRQSAAARSAEKGSTGGSSSRSASTTAAAAAALQCSSLQPLYSWAQCLDRQFYSQAWKPAAAAAAAAVAPQQQQLLGVQQQQHLLSQDALMSAPGSPQIKRGSSHLSMSVSPATAARIASAAAAASNLRHKLLRKKPSLASGTGSSPASGSSTPQPVQPQHANTDNSAADTTTDAAASVTAATASIARADAEFNERLALALLQGPGAGGPPVHLVRVTRDRHRAPEAACVFTSDAEAWCTAHGLDAEPAAAAARIAGLITARIMRRVANWHHIGGAERCRDPLLRYVDRWETVSNCHLCDSIWYTTV